MENAELDPRYTPKAEHYALRERVAVLENEVRRDLAEIKRGQERMEAKLSERVQPPQSMSSIDNLALAMQRGLSEGSKKGGPFLSNVQMAMLIAGVIGFAWLKHVGVM